MLQQAYGGFWGAKDPLLTSSSLPPRVPMPSLPGASQGAYDIMHSHWLSLFQRSRPAGLAECKLFTVRMTGRGRCELGAALCTASSAEAQILGFVTSASVHGCEAQPVGLAVCVDAAQDVAQSVALLNPYAHKCWRRVALQRVL